MYDSPVQVRRSKGCPSGSPFTKLVLDKAYGYAPPKAPRIARFSFEHSDVGCELPSSLSGPFPSYYGLPYVPESPPGYVEDAHSELSSRGPTTPPTDRSPPFAQDSPSLISRNKSLDDPFSRMSPTLLLGPRSFSPTQSLLDDTRSVLELYGASENPRDSIRSSGSLLESPSLPYTLFQPSPSSHPLPEPITMQQPTSCPAKDPVVQNARRSRTSSNRRVTVHQLALDLPQACSQSNSLSAFITALENASPGWCRSLMDSALPQSDSSSSPQAAKLAPPSDSSSGSLGSRPEDSGSASSDSLQCDLLEILDELEELAAVIRCLPIPRPRTMTLDDVASAFLPPAWSTRTLERRHFTMSAAVSCSSSLIQLRGRGSTPTVLSEFSFEAEASPERSLPSDTTSAPRYTPDRNQPAIDNLVYHPKLARTLGLQSLPSWGVPDASPRTPSPQQPYSPPTSSGSGSQPSRSPFGRTPPLPPQTPEKTSQSSFKTPKSLRLASLFRRRPSTPAVVDDWPAAQDGRSGGSPASRNGHGRGALALSELGKRALGPGSSTRSSNGSPTSKTASGFSPMLGEPPNPLPHPNFNGRQRRLDSFLLM